MEAANEAARRAVNGILDASGSDASQCKVRPLRELASCRPCAFGPRTMGDPEAGPLGAAGPCRERDLVSGLLGLRAATAD